MADKTPTKTPVMQIKITATPKAGTVHVSAEMMTASGRVFCAGQNADSGNDVLRAVKEIAELLAIQAHGVDVLDPQAHKLAQPDFKPLHIA